MPCIFVIVMDTLLDLAKASIMALPATKRIIALDLGSTTIGLATADFTRQFATPRHTIARTKFQADAKALLDFIGKEQVGLIVMGLPFNMDGSEGRRAQSTRALQKLTALPIIYWDERLSTFEAEEQMRDAGVNYAKRQQQIDQQAAAVILQSLLDQIA
jgi:putative holliday junction resolvase